MRRPIVILAACALCLLAVGPAPRYLEQLRIGGGYGSAPDGGADFEANGDILTDGNVTVKGTITSGGFNDSTLAGYWPLNEGSGGTVRDIGPGENAGTITAGSGGWSDDSPFRHAYNFNGSSINCGVGSELDTRGPQTLTAWIKPSGWGGFGTGTIVSKSDSSSRLDAFWVNQENSCLWFRRRFSGGVGYGGWRSAANSVQLNRWQFVAVTYDHSSASNDPVFYVNGRLVSTVEESTPSGLPLSHPTEPLLLGNTKISIYGFLGRIAEVRFYKRMLSPDEIAGLYRAASESPVFQSLSCAGGNLDVGTSTTARGVVTLNQGGTNAPGCIRLLSPAGTGWYLFVEDDGTLKLHNALPTLNTDGTVVGTQQ
jgi:hypothetical protein